jgi:glycerate kinase
VAKLAKKHGAAVIAFCGSADGGAAINACGIDAYFPILPGPMSLQEAMAPGTAEKNLEETARQVFLLIGKLRPPAETGERP